MVEQSLALQASNPQIKIRPVRLTDVPALHEVCWPERSVAYVSQLIHRARHIALQGRGLGVVAVDAMPTDVQGFGQMTLWPRGGEISDLVVGRCFRRRGLGTAIIQYLVQTAREMNVSSVEIGVAEENTAAVALYRRLGFTDGYTVVLNLGNGPEPVIYLQLELPPPERKPVG